MTETFKITLLFIFYCYTGKPKTLRIFKECKLLINLKNNWNSKLRGANIVEGSSLFLGDISIEDSQIFFSDFQMFPIFKKTRK